MTLVESSIRFVLGSLVMVALCLALVPVMLLLLPWRVLRLKACNVFGSLLGSACVAITGARVVFHDRERINTSSPAIYVSNHTSALDMWLGMWLCPVGGAGLAKKEIARIPGLGQLYLLSGHPLIDRENRQRAIATMKEVSAFMVRHKLSLWIWPEGTRSETGRLGPFKKGFAHAALATGLPVVPVVVFNATSVWPRHTMRLNAATVHIQALEPIDTSNWTIDSLDSHVDQVRQVFVDALETPLEA